MPLRISWTMQKQEVYESLCHGEGVELVRWERGLVGSKELLRILERPSGHLQYECLGFGTPNFIEVAF